MLRAAAAVESASVPSVSLVCRGFEGLSNATSEGVGYPGLPLAVLSGHVDTQTYDEMVDLLLAETMDQIVAGLTTGVASGPALDVEDRPAGSTHGPAPTDPAPTDPVSTDPAPTETVASGSLEEVNDRFAGEGWSDGLPIIPPTVSRIERFLADSSFDPHQALHVIKPSGRVVTPWVIAANAVMAGCEPKVLPVLLALAEVIADDTYGVEHSGNTTGADALIVLNGPSIEALGFNSGQGAMREGFRSNVSVARWFRLFLRNVCGFVPGAHDKATFGNSTRVVLAEHEETLDSIGWTRFGEDLGLAAEDDIASVGRFNSGVIIGSVVGSTPEQILPYLADGLVRVSSWELTHVYGIGQGHYRPLLILSPMLARVFGDAGWSKDDVRAALFDEARMPAEKFERYIGEWSNLTAGRRTLQDLAAFRKVPKVFRGSDPQRLVPIVTEPNKFLIAVAGDPDRANAYAMSNDGPHGYPTAKQIQGLGGSAAS